MASTPHPYSPANAAIVNYVPNELSTPEIFSRFGGMISVVLAVLVGLARLLNPRLSRGALAAVTWYCLCGFLHCVFEAYFVLTNRQIAASQDLFSQMWKEYGLSDSRYLDGNILVLMIEGFTVLVWGPLCFVIAACIVKESTWRHPLQMMVAIGHLYGVTIYGATALMDHVMNGISCSRPEALYLYVYFVILNAPWVIVPAYLLKDSVVTMKAALDRAQRGATKPRLEAKKSR